MATIPTMGRLDGPPPLPPDLAMTQAPPPAQGPKLDQLAGQSPMGSGGVASGAAFGLAMQIEQAITQLSQMLPEFAPAGDQIVSILRSGVVQATQSTATSQPVPSGMLPMATGMGTVAQPM